MTQKRLADACGFDEGSFRDEYGGRLHKWDEAERAELMAERIVQKYAEMSFPG